MRVQLKTLNVDFSRRLIYISNNRSLIGNGPQKTTRILPERVQCTDLQVYLKETLCHEDLFINNTESHLNMIFHFTVLKVRT